MENLHPKGRERGEEKAWERRDESKRRENFHPDCRDEQKKSSHNHNCRGGKKLLTRYRKNANDEYTQSWDPKLLRKLVCKWRFESKRNGMEKGT